MKSQIGKTLVKGNVQEVVGPGEFACLSTELSTYKPDGVKNGDVCITIDTHKGYLWDADSEQWR